MWTIFFGKFLAAWLARAYDAVIQTAIYRTMDPSIALKGIKMVESDTPKCPSCLREIPKEAKKCPHCGNNIMDSKGVAKLASECKEYFDKLTDLQNVIRKKLTAHADGKNLKGNELVGWLGEIYGKILYQGELADDRMEHDFVTIDKLRISVKTRKGRNPGWNRSSAIPKIEGDGCPTHLLFVHLNDNYSIDKIWRFDWNYLYKNNRFNPHKVRGQHRSWIFFLNENEDKMFCVYPETDMTSTQC